MNFITWDLSNILQTLELLQPESRPLWGNFSAQHMVEHLCGGLKMSMGKISFTMEASEEKSLRMKSFLFNDQPFAHNIPVGFVQQNEPLTQEELALAIDEFIHEFLAFNEYYEANPTRQHTHPFFGSLNHEAWILLHRKHITHHFEQFGLLKTEKSNK
jgi:oxepin-CoA hydrolase/3-oxo-5,6-dehydrosuberyl-CoA semialdehyde dehydrogenase